MKPTAKIIGLFGVIQMTVIATGWFATKALRKSFLVALESDEVTKPVRGLAEFFAAHGLWGLLIPPIWCLFVISMSEDTERDTDTSAVAKVSLVFTGILFLGCILAFMDMALSFSTVIKAK